jgi:hypothetical protein
MPLAQMPLYLRFLPRAVNVTAEHVTRDKDYKFRSADLFFSAYETLFRRGQLAGVAAWWKSGNGNPRAPDVNLTLNVRKHYPVDDPAIEFRRSTSIHQTALRDRGLDWRQRSDHR